MPTHPPTRESRIWKRVVVMLRDHGPMNCAEMAEMTGQHLCNFHDALKCAVAAGDAVRLPRVGRVAYKFDLTEQGRQYADVVAGAQHQRKRRSPAAPCARTRISSRARALPRDQAFTHTLVAAGQWLLRGKPGRNSVFDVGAGGAG